MTPNTFRRHFELFFQILFFYFRFKERKKQKQIMSEIVETKFKTPKRVLSHSNINSNHVSTPLLVPPSPMLQQMGFGTGKLHIFSTKKGLILLKFSIFAGVHIYRIERSPKVGKTLSPWVVKRIRGQTKKDIGNNKLISSRLAAEADILR